jgi:pimeloyl-ACP methyl ester carboxylesterase
MRRNRAVFGLLWASGTALLAPAAGVAQSGPPSPLTEDPCRLAMDPLPAAYARCGTVEVPLDPATPDGAKVGLFVARIAALSAEPRLDPVLLIAGGPGQSTVDMYLQQRGAFEQVRRERDLILVDQRGTGRSAAGFECNVRDDLSLDTAGVEELTRAVDDCLAKLERDPRFYTTSVAVQDLERVRAALRLAQWNIYGVSYGTRVAQHYLRRYPEQVRAVVLDGVVPPPLALGPDVAREAQRALEQIFARCAADAQCGARFTNLPGTFSELLARLDSAATADGAARPPLTALELRVLVRFMSYNVATVSLLPVFISEAHAGNYTPLANQARRLLRDLPESLSFPMSNSVTCTEDVRFIDTAANDDLGGTYLGTSIVEGLRGLCSRWPVGVMDEDFKTSVVSDKPVLLLSGEFDPITPPAYAERVAAEGLRNSVHVVGRGQGHGLIAVGCVPRILRAFIESPVPADLDASCLEDEPPTPSFLTLLGPAP